MGDAKNDGGPAYPVPTDMSGGEAFYLATPGMSLRDWFAGQALAGIAANNHMEGGSASGYSPSAVARKAYRVADAMLEARK